MDPSCAFRVATLNVFHDPPVPSWPARAPLVVAGFRALRADLIMLQEVAWPNEQASELAEALSAGNGSRFDALVMPLITPQGWQEGLAVLSRYRVLAHEALRYPRAEQFCQRVRVEIGGHEVDVYNTHLDPYSADRRQEQVRLILGWMAAHADARGLLFGGDLNATPDSPEIGLLRTTLRSAHVTVHGREPAGTAPTPFRGGPNRPTRTLNYLWHSPALSSTACQVTFDRPDPHDRSLFASDHVGLWADMCLVGDDREVARERVTTLPAGPNA
jgi:endonuclease/exonuclease/phosphatase family metal-dependent hydrolase